MARKPQQDVSDPQLTFEDWVEAVSSEREGGPPPADAASVVASLAEALAPRLAEELRARIPPPATQQPPPAAAYSQ